MGGSREGRIRGGRKKKSRSAGKQQYIQSREEREGKERGGGRRTAMSLLRISQFATMQRMIHQTMLQWRE